MIDIYSYQTGPIQVNTYLVFDETKEAFIVDPGGPSNDLFNMVSAEGLNVTHVIITHGHADHIGAVELMRAAFPGLKVIAGADETEVLKRPAWNGSLNVLGYEVSIDVDIPVKDEDHIKIGDMDIRFLETPGHSVGSISAYVGDVVFTGDALFQGSIGRTDLKGGDYLVLSRSIKNKLYTLPDETMVLPGHGGPSRIGIEKQYNPFVRANDKIPDIQF